MSQYAIKLTDRANVPAADVSMADSPTQPREWSRDGVSMNDVASPAILLQEQIAASFAGSPEQVWSRRRGLAFAVSVSLAGWLAIALSLKAMF